MIPTGRLWVTACLLALPTIVAGFLPGMWTLVILLDVALPPLLAFSACPRG